MEGRTARKEKEGQREKDLMRVGKDSEERRGRAARKGREEQ